MGGYCRIFPPVLVSNVAVKKWVSTYAAPAMQEVVGNEFCEQLYEPRKSAGQKLFALCTLATMIPIGQL
jgi:hypothetical protein